MSPVAAWKSLRLKSLVSVVGGGTPDTDEDNWNGDIPFVTPPDLRPVHGGVCERTSRHLSVRGARQGSTVVEGGAILVSKRAPIGYVSRIAMRAAFNQGCLALVPRLNGDADMAFLTWALSVRGVEMNMLGRGTTFMEIAAGDLANLLVSVPPLPEQRRIAIYLDRATAKIDALIGKQEQLIIALRERRTALILHATLGAADVAWKGRLGRVLSKLGRPTTGKNGVVTAYRDGTVTRRSLRREEGYTFSNAEAGYQGVAKGDLVFHGLDGFAGAVGVSDADGDCSPVYHVCRPTGSDARYLAYLLRAMGVSGLLSAHAWSVRQRSVDYRNWALFAALPLALPSIETQRAIADLLDEQIEKIDLLVERAERFIGLSQERRSGLISAVVTGQMDVGGGIDLDDLQGTTDQGMA